MESFRKQLQASTAAPHLALENTRLMQGIACGKVDVDTYRQYLVCQYRLFAPLEVQLRIWVQPDLATTRLVKSTWLLADLRALGCQSGGTFATVPDITSQAHAFGVQYVLEGSMLGLQVIKKSLPPEHPAYHRAGRFIQGNGTDTAHHWKAFLLQLEALPQQERPQATAAALATFGAFQREFEGVTNV